ncbi:MAG: zinc ribbon domain-containing protein [Rubrivivax sp.]|nr:zinc ribbon domain-containing protein [Pyrinomonadaceae bacterium]
MFCPKCGQQQISDNTRFCSRCGLAVSGLAEWVAGGGVLAARAEAAPAAVVQPRRKGMTRGAKLMFFSVVLMPVFLGISIVGDWPGPLLIPFTLFLVGLSWLLYYFIFGEKTSPAATRQAQPSRLGTTADSPYLPPASSVPVGSVGEQRLRTAELVQPPSVTENTTKLLDSD